MRNMVGMRKRLFCDMAMAACCALMALGQTLGQASGQASGPWVLEQSGTTAGLRGIHAVGGGVAWASGTNGTVLRTEDGGYEWQSCAMPPGAEKLDFRGVWAWDANTAIVMSSGTGNLSRIYKTTDGCSSWKLLFTNPDKDGFWDAMVFFDRRIGWLLGDPVNGRFQLWKTTAGGEKWEREASSRALRADPKEQGAFAASNSALLAGGAGGGFPVFGSGGTSGAYVYRIAGISVCLDDCAQRPKDLWTRSSTPMAEGTASAGIFSVAAQGERRVVVGGDYAKPNESAGTGAWSSDGGKTWVAAAQPPHGFRSAVAWDAEKQAWIAAGTNGSDVSWDGGKTWVSLDDGNWNALSLPWVVGPGGRIAKLDAGQVKKP
ncbi:MAG TPA: hypothetical protein VHX60_01895 [Acidobacteriaceae bacterium]|nr:hypothetical protein [Acidobacteriaceae bacterium]